MSVEFIDNSDEVMEALEAQLKEAYGDIGDILVKSIKGNCPVDTGNLQRSISSEVEGEGVVVGTNVEYAPYVELGAKGRKPTHFMQKGALESAESIKSALIKHLKQ